MNAGRAEYQRRMHRVQAYIDAHLADPLDLATLAGVANFSPYHFHRLFAAWMGETLADHVRRRRLQVAAVQLLAQPRLPVLHAALGVGFGSAEAFSRAFRGHFGASPSAWRAAQRKQSQGQRNPDQADGAPRDDDGATMNSRPLDVQLIDLPATRVAYLRHHGPYGPAVHRFWTEVAGPWLLLHGRTGRDCYGLSHDDPGVTRPEDCRYDAAVALLPGEAVGRDELVAELPAGRYAVCRFDAPLEHIGEAWQRLLRDWLPATGMQLDARPCFERYRVDPVFDPVTGHMRCEICIPVSPL